MKTRNLFIAIVAVSALAVGTYAFAGSGWGHGPGICGQGYGQGYGQGGRGLGPGACGLGPGARGRGAALTQEEQEKAQALSTEYADKTEGLRRKLFAKDAELEAAFAAEKPDAAKIKSLSKAVGEVRSELFELDNEYRLKLQEAGLAGPMGRGFARGGRGFGPGFGPGNCPFGGPDRDRDDNS